MSRAEILFTSAYQFKGYLNLTLIEKSARAILNQITKFQQQLEFNSQRELRWVPSKRSGSFFHQFKAPNLAAKLKEISADGFQLRATSRDFPMNFVVIQQAATEVPEANSQDESFMLATLCSHEYVDARSAEMIFGLIVQHYNALCADALGHNNQGLCHQLEAKAAQYHTPSAAELIAKVAHPHYDTEVNGQFLNDYQTEDQGGWGVSIQQVEQLLPHFFVRRREPVSREVHVAALISRCREHHPELSKNAIVTAALHKAIYHQNLKRGLPEQQLISGRTVSDLLTPQQRSAYIGNLIAFVPVSAPGQLTLIETAKAIHDRIVAFKSSQQNLTCFEAVEAAAEAEVVGTVDDPLSYIITNWTNHQFVNSPEYLHGAQSIGHQSAVNVNPKDVTGAALINRPVVVISFSSEHQLSLSMFPSLRSDLENERLMDEMANCLTI